MICRFRCSVCERLFNTVMELEHHKEEHGHWSDEEEESERYSNLCLVEDDIRAMNILDRVIMRG